MLWKQTPSEPLCIDCGMRLLSSESMFCFAFVQKHLDGLLAGESPEDVI
ncbi:hypothetical protein IJJ46_01365 [Candidatus Saccharibacteria bacterium]|nr:hypothetical protein [Candidatus Saccharibacteria bacterium]